ncbi:MAG: phospholipase D-like domain-containing protein [Bacteroidales bacterium]
MSPKKLLAILLAAGQVVSSFAQGIFFTEKPYPVSITQHNITLQWKTNQPTAAGAYYAESLPTKFLLQTTKTEDSVHQITIPVSGPSILVKAVPFSIYGNDTLRGDTLVMMSQSASTGQIKVFFTRPVDVSVSTGNPAVYLPGTAPDTVIALIKKAKKSIDLAIYNMNIDQIGYALNQAKARGVRVRVIYDGSTSNSSIYVLQGIPTLASPQGSSYSIMHNKFLVIDCDTDNADDAWLLTGSMNFTTNQVTTDANNFLIIQDKSLALAYRMEFEEMWGGSGDQPNLAASKFGPYKTNNTPHYFNIGGRPVESWFSPSDGVTAKIKAAINSANTSLFIPTNLITRDDLADAIAQRRAQNVMTKVIVDDDASCTSSVVSTLTQALGSNFRETSESGLLHHKALIADALNPLSNPLVLTGSHNWSNNAENRNDENTLIIYDAQIANLYYQEFAARFKNSKIIASNPKLDLGPDITVCAGQKVIIDAGKGFTSYTWSNGGYGSQILLDTTGVGATSLTVGCTVSNAFGTQTDQITVTFTLCTGLEEPRDTHEDLWVFPNPAEDFINIRNQPAVGTLLVSIFDVNGKKVWQSIYDASVHEIRLLTGGLKPGLYIISASSAKSTHTARFLKK